MSAEAAFKRALEAPRAEREPAWLEGLRGEARDAFLAHGLPTTRDEDWRYTPLAKLEKLDLSGPTPGSVAGATSLREVLERDPERVRRVLGRCGDPKRRPFEALNAALFTDGAFIELAPGVQVEKPIQLQVGPGHVRNLISAGPGSRAVIVEDCRGTGLTNSVTELALEPGAQVDHVLVQDLPGDAVGFFALLARQERDSRLHLHSIALGASLARVEIEVRLEGEGAELDLDGLYLGRGNQHQDHHTTIDHASPRTTSRELFKGILADKAHGVFHGRVHVRPDAQKIDASQTNRALLLSDGAVLDSKPQLEIYADDVKCSHGASIGQLDPDQIFYLRARGLGLERARALLTFAFASQVLARLPLADLRESLESRVHGWLPGGDA
jgi:Fe-S cluster assembly protein SufD